MQPNLITAWERTAPEVPTLKTINLADLLAKEIPPREMILGPIIPRQGLAMIYAPRGIGKTHVALGLAYAIATGSTFLRWTAPAPARVLLIDGEMPEIRLQERFAAIVAASDAQDPNPDFLTILANDIQEDTFASIGTPEGREALEPHIENADIVILDNLSTLSGSVREKEGDDWTEIQGWLLTLRRRGKAVLLIHHAGKNGEQRGTSRREDILDTVVALRRPKDYEGKQGARFHVHYEKARGLFGDDARPFEARLSIENGRATWSTDDLEEIEYIRVIELLKEGVPERDIAEETGVSKSTVNRWKKRAQTEGKL